MRGVRRLFGLGEVLIALMAIVAGSALIGAFTGWQFFPVVAAGVAVAVATSLAARRFKLRVAEWLTLDIAAFAILGAFVTRGVPTPGAYSAFFRGLIDGWADVLSSVPPTALSAEYRVVPYALAWLGATAGLGLLRTVRLPGFAALGPLAAFGLGLLFAVEDRWVSIVQGGLLVGLALALGVFQQRDLGTELDQSIGNTTIVQRRRRVLSAAGVLLLIVGLAPAAASVVPGFADQERFDLRDRLVPPWEPLEEASPLSEIKANYDDAVRDDVVFVAAGEVVPRRFALATLAHYDGRVWTVGSSELSGSAPFIALDRVAPAVEDVYDTEPIELVITASNLDGVWFPLPGQLQEVVDRAGGLASPIRFNQRTGTLALPEGVQGEQLVVSVRPQPVLSVEEIEALTVTPASPIGVAGQTAVIRSRSADMVEGAEQGWAQVDAIRSSLTTNGYYLVDDKNRPGHSWGRLTDFFAEDQWAGNEEQYAAVAGIVARNTGLPVRVVVGYKLDEDKPQTGEVEVERGEAAAWIEIETVEHGWIAVDVTPDRDREPDFTDPGVRTEAVAAPNPPPPPPPPPDIEAERPDEEEEDEEEDEEEEVVADEGIPRIALMAAGSLGGPVGLAGVWIALCGSLKALVRRRRRNTADLSRRTANAWHEAIDRLWEFGCSPAPKLSVIEQAHRIEAAVPSASGLLLLASAADRAAFGPGGASDELAARAWTYSDSIKQGLRDDSSFGRRLRQLADPRPILRRTNR